MSEKNQNKPAAEVPAAAKPAKKLQPRVVPKQDVPLVVAEAVVEKKPAVETKPAVKKATARKPTKLDETKARNKKALAEALAKAQAVQIVPPVVMPASPVAAPVAKAVKPKKVKLVRHSFSMPETEYAQFALLKKRVADFGGKVKRSELVRAGIAVLSALDNVELTAAVARVERIKAGRPTK